MSVTSASDEPPQRSISTYKMAFTMKEAVIASGVCRTRLYLDIKGGLLKIRKRGSQTLILAEELYRYLHDLPEGEL